MGGSACGSMPYPRGLCCPHDLQVSGLPSRCEPQRRQLCLLTEGVCPVRINRQAVWHTQQAITVMNIPGRATMPSCCPSGQNIETMPNAVASKPNTSSGRPTSSRRQKPVSDLSSCFTTPVFHLNHHAVLRPWSPSVGMKADPERAQSGIRNRMGRMLATPRGSGPSGAIRLPGRGRFRNGHLRDPQGGDPLMSPGIVIA